MSNYFKRIVCSLASGAVLSSVAYAQEAEDPAYKQVVAMLK